ncbi:aldo/keto reductase [Paenibacillus pabuli]
MLELNVMKLALGTAQLGMPYGIANISGQPDYAEAIRLVRTAMTKGIHVIDTAPGYGDSEYILGKARYGITNTPVIITKIPLIPERNEVELQDIRKSMMQYIEESKLRLGVLRLDCCLLHSPDNMLSHDRKVVQVLCELKAQGHVEKIGVSIYTPEDVETFLELEDMDVIQIPINILDQRLITSGQLERLKTRKISIHARSIYLQGLLLLSPDQLPEYMSAAKIHLSNLRLLAERNHYSITELAFIYIRDLRHIDYMVIGCETLEQLEDNVRMLELPPLSSVVSEEAMQLFSRVPECILNPSKWRA